MELGRKPSSSSYQHYLCLLLSNHRLLHRRYPILRGRLRCCDHSRRCDIASPIGRHRSIFFPGSASRRRHHHRRDGQRRGRVATTAGNKESAPAHSKKHMQWNVRSPPICFLHVRTHAPRPLGWHRPRQSARVQHPSRHAGVVNMSHTWALSLLPSL